MSRLTQTLIVATTFSLPLAALNYPVHGFSIFLSLVLWRHYFPLPPEVESSEQKEKNKQLPSREQYLANLREDSTTTKERPNTIRESTEPARNKETSERAENECLICWSSPSITLHCKHSFCLPCLTSYFIARASKNSCPVCSIPLFKPALFTSENTNIWCNKMRITMSVLILCLYFLRLISCYTILHPFTNIFASGKCTISAGNSSGWVGIILQEVPYLVLSAAQIWWYRRMVGEMGNDWTGGEMKWTTLVPAVGLVQKVAGMVWRVETIVGMAGRIGWKRWIG